MVIYPFKKGNLDIVSIPSKLKLNPFFHPQHKLDHH
jgi:hypothetical protein